MQDNIFTKKLGWVEKAWEIRVFYVRILSKTKSEIQGRFLED